MKTGYVYLARPIDQVTEYAGLGEAMDWHRRVGQVKEWIVSRGWGVYDPAEAFTVSSRQEPDRSLAVVNHVALGRSRGVVAFLPPGVASIGVPIEIDRAAKNGTPVLVIGGEGSWMLANYENYPNVRVGQPMEPVEALLAWLLDLAGTLGPETRREPLPFASVREQEKAILPQLQYTGDVGFDLTVTQDTTVPTFGMADVPCNVAVELPEWGFGLIVGRSSAMRVKGLQVHPGVIDTGYRGELFAAASSLTGKQVEVKAGERLAQLIVLSNHARMLTPVMVDQLNESERGTNGFGSTGG